MVITSAVFGAILSHLPEANLEQFCQSTKWPVSPLVQFDDIRYGSVVQKLWSRRWQCLSVTLSILSFFLRFITFLIFYLFFVPSVFSLFPSFCKRIQDIYTAIYASKSPGETEKYKKSQDTRQHVHDRTRYLPDMSRSLRPIIPLASHTGRFSMPSRS